MICGSTAGTANASAFSHRQAVTAHTRLVIRLPMGHIWLQRAKVGTLRKLTMGSVVLWVSLRMCHPNGVDTVHSHQCLLKSKQGPIGASKTEQDVL